LFPSFFPLLNHAKPPGFSLLFKKTEPVPTRTKPRTGFTLPWIYSVKFGQATHLT
jgi:hypothetical protein